MATNQPTWPVMKILGKKVFWVFALVTFLVVAILAASNLISKHALKEYTEDQINRLHWDAMAYQTTDIPEIGNLRSGIGKIAGVSRVGFIGSLRFRLGTGLRMQIGGRDRDLPWCVLLSFEDTSRLPVTLRSSTGGAHMALISTEAVLTPQEIDAPSMKSLQIDYTDQKTHERTQLFTTQVDSISQPERMDIVKWLMDEYGPVTFIPDRSVLLILPKSQFDVELPKITELISLLTKPDKRGEAGEANDEALGGEPLSTVMRVMIMHPFAMDRGNLFTGWDIEGSRQKIANVIREARWVIKEISLESFVNSDLQITLSKMSQASKLIGLFTVLISIPILWMAWYFAGSLTSLVILNQRRTVGLLRLRGTAFRPIRRSLLAAIGLGGIVGGLAGALAGTLVPYGLYRMAGVRIPARLLFRTVQSPAYLALFVVIGTLFSLVAGKTIIDYMAKITPLEASRRVASTEGMLSFKFKPIHSASLLIGCAKMLGWLLGFTPRTEFLQRVDMVANFIAVPLFVYGMLALIVSRSQMLHWILHRLAYPFGGSMTPFAVTDLLSRPARVMSGILVAALAFSVVVYPRITADSFYDKALRGLQLNLGSDIAVRFEGSALLPNAAGAQPVEWHQKQLGQRMQEIERQIRSIPGVREVNTLYKFAVPGTFYIPGKSYLQLYLVGNPERFFNSVHFENRLGITKPFQDLMQELGKNKVIVSKGFAEVYGDSQNGALPERLTLGRSPDDKNVTAPLAGVTYLLPGTMQMMLADRESYSSADVEFLNSITQTNPYVVGRLGDPSVGQLNAFLAGAVSVIKMDSRATGAAPIAQGILRLAQQGSIPKIAELTTEEAERGKLSHDMFVYLGLENLKVFMIGGMLTAAFAIIAIAWVNFVERRRTFGLFRIRGASPRMMLRVILSQMLVPVLMGGLVGIVAGLLAGYGMTTAIFTLPKVSSILQVLRVHLIVGPLAALLIVTVFLIFFVVVLLLSSWIFRSSARESVAEG